jgi:AcrR family transcriptional regulator
MVEISPVLEPASETRSDRRKRRNRQAVIDAASRVMSEKGIDAATMSEIA